MKTPCGGGFKEVEGQCRVNFKQSVVSSEKCLAPFSVVEEAVKSSLVAYSFAFPQDEQGKRYVTITHDKIMKNHASRLHGKFSYKKAV